LLEVRPATDAAAVVAPGLLLWVVPSAVRQATDDRAVGTAAVLASPAGTFEAHAPAEVTPMWGIEGLELASNWHCLARSYPANPVLMRGLGGFAGTLIVFQLRQQ
jgi:hypothetical protein